MQGKKRTKEEVELWYEEYKLGKNHTEISKKFNVHPTTINNHFKKNNYNYTWDLYHVKLSQEDLELFRKAKDYYIDGNSMAGSMKKFGIPVSRASGFRSYLKRCGVKIKGLSEVASFVNNHDYFQDIDSEVKAYLLGFFAADGHIEHRKDYDSYTLRICVHLDDVHILMLFNNQITNGRSAITVSKSRNIASIALTSKKIGEDLLKLGFDSNKTHSWKTLPKIPEKLYKHFIRGFFDGDGSVSVNPRKSGNRIAGFNRNCCIACANENILDEISDKIGIKFNKFSKEPCSAVVNGSFANFSKTYYIKLWNLSDLRAFHKYMYDNSNYYFLRKKHKFDLAIMDDIKYYASLQGNL